MILRTTGGDVRPGRGKDHGEIPLLINEEEKERITFQLPRNVPSVIPAKVNPVRKALITAVTKTTTDIFQAADEITPLTLVAAARVRAARG